MAGGQSMVSNNMEKSLMKQQHQWQAKYARCFTFPTTYLSNSTISCHPSLHQSKRNYFKPFWISTAGSATISLNPCVDVSSSSDSILTIYLQDTIIEEHFISKLNFTWPQVSCVSGFPSRGSLVVFASYKDSADEKQKFALRFSTIKETENFISSLEDMFSNKMPNGLPALDVISAISSQSEFVPPYRPDVSNVRSPTFSSPMPIYSTEDLQQANAQAQAQPLDGVAHNKNNVLTFPPSFTSLVSNCSADIEKDALPLALPNGTKDLNLKAQIAKYMQDASFLDMVNKVNEVISDLGEDFVL